jgi:hypothetical protein
MSKKIKFLDFLKSDHDFYKEDKNQNSHTWSPQTPHERVT